MRSVRRATERSWRAARLENQQVGPKLTSLRARAPGASSGLDSCSASQRHDNGLWHRELNGCLQEIYDLVAAHVREPSSVNVATYADTHIRSLVLYASTRRACAEMGAQLKRSALDAFGVANIAWGWPRCARRAVVSRAVVSRATVSRAVVSSRR